jgi:hypothetical protein
MRSDGNQHHTGLEQNLDKAIRKYKHFFVKQRIQFWFIGRFNEACL